MRFLFALLLVGCPLAAANTSATEPSPLEKDKQHLSSLQAYVGEWRGIGLPKRGSNQGGWSETAEWSWKFADGRAALVAQFKPGKYFERIEVLPGEQESEFIVDGFAKAVDASAAVRLRGAQQDGQLTAVAEKAHEGLPERISIRLVADGDRMSVLYERRLSEDSFGRMAEVGSTRKGSSFAKRAASGPECVVTGGLGTIAVEHDGKTYFVCCGGCKDLFEEDPAGVLADYRERKATEKAEK